MKYISAFILTILYSPMLLIWFLMDCANGENNAGSLLEDWWY